MSGFELGRDTANIANDNLVSKKITPIVRLGLLLDIDAGCYHLDSIL